jgi:hypothetical protein
MTTFLLIVIVVLLIGIGWTLSSIKDALESIDRHLESLESQPMNVSEDVQDALYGHFIVQSYKSRTDYPPPGQHERQDK